MSSRFRLAIEAADADALAAALHPDVVFNSPVVFKPYVGREAAMRVLREVIQVSEDFHYTDELTGPEGTRGLVFRARIGELELQGWDLVRVDAEGLVTELTVMVRPLKATLALAQAMAQRLGVSPTGSSAAVPSRPA